MKDRYEIIGIEIHNVDTIEKVKDFIKITKEIETILRKHKVDFVMIQDESLINDKFKKQLQLAKAEKDNYKQYINGMKAKYGDNVEFDLKYDKDYQQYVLYTKIKEKNNVKD